MFDFAWSEIALIGVVALVLIGPKDMPVAIKAVADMVRKARKMAGEFQTHVDEMTKDTGIAEVRQQIQSIRNMDIRGEIERAVDADGSIRQTFADDPFRSTTPPPTPTDIPALEPHSIGAPVEHDTPAVAAAEAEAKAEAAPPASSSPAAPPAFIPPSVARAKPMAASAGDPQQDAAGV